MLASEAVDASSPKADEPGSPQAGAKAKKKPAKKSVAKKAKFDEPGGDPEGEDLVTSKESMDSGADSVKRPPRRKSVTKKAKISAPECTPKSATGGTNGQDAPDFPTVLPSVPNGISEVGRQIETTFMMPTASDGGSKDSDTKQMKKTVSFDGLEEESEEPTGYLLDSWASNFERGKAKERMEGNKLEVPEGSKIAERLMEERGQGISFLELAIGMTTELEKLLPGHETEFEFVNDCLGATLNQLQLPCGLMAPNCSQKKVHDTIRKSIMPESRGPDRPSARTDSAWKTTPRFRGTLRACRAEADSNEERRQTKMMALGPTASLRSSNFVSEKESEGSNDSQGSQEKPAYMDDGSMQGISAPWMGLAVPRLPVKVPPALQAQVEKTLDMSFNNWGFDIFDFAKLTDGKPLQFIAWEALCRGSCFSEFAINPGKAAIFCQEVERMYRPSPDISYHNNLHAADVTQTVHTLIQTVGFSQFFDPMDTMGLIVGAIIHDMGHDGRTNAFHIATMDELALTYNDKSVLENFHASQGFKLLRNKPETNFLQDLERDQCKVLRQEIISAVLGTDMSFHFGAVSEFGTLSTKLGQDPKNWQGEEKSMDLFRCMVLHAADLANPTKGLRVSQEWSERALREFFSQGDEERRLGLPISPLCDRVTTNVPGSQIGFIDFVVRPTYDVLKLVEPCTETCIEGLLAARKMWETRKGNYEAQDASI